ncbi:hypothetical protein IE53DRAFT_383410 [Violaceomyces palustris]|uniref:Uncharacterized protein n=1 Tax=Violaceomyces palustris TaxID=1673888 RepID=A0ACD0P7P6_9BASI|nr:hypothetical protein IE53DRAFT_383410 [Violaceomyces palustris]
MKQSKRKKSKISPKQAHNLRWPATSKDVSHARREHQLVEAIKHNAKVFANPPIPAELWIDIATLACQSCPKGRATLYSLSSTCKAFYQLVRPLRFQLFPLPLTSDSERMSALVSYFLRNPREIETIRGLKLRFWKMDETEMRINQKRPIKLLERIPPKVEELEIQCLDLTESSYWLIRPLFLSINKSLKVLRLEITTMIPLYQHMLSDQRIVPRARKDIFPSIREVIFDIRKLRYNERVHTQRKHPESLYCHVLGSFLRHPSLRDVQIKFDFGKGFCDRHGGWLLQILKSLSFVKEIRLEGDLYYCCDDAWWARSKVLQLGNVIATGALAGLKTDAVAQHLVDPDLRVGHKAPFIWW